jgi:hypothetical protein
MAGSRSGPEAWSVVVSVVVAGSHGYELVGGCVEPGDLPVSPAVPAAQNPSSPDPRSPLRP